MRFKIDKDDAQKLVNYAIKISVLNEVMDFLSTKVFEESVMLCNILKSSTLEVPSIGDSTFEIRCEYNKCFNEFSALYLKCFGCHCDDDDLDKVIAMIVIMADSFKNKKKKKGKSDESKLHRDDIDAYDAFRYESLRLFLEEQDNDDYGMIDRDEEMSEFGLIMRNRFINSSYGSYTYSEMNETMKNVIKEYYKDL
jgi:hypothetical protein